MTEKLKVRERFIVEDDRVFDTQDGVYYIRECAAVKHLNERLEQAAWLAGASTGKRIRELKECV